MRRGEVVQQRLARGIRRRRREVDTHTEEEVRKSVGWGIESLRSLFRQSSTTKEMVARLGGLFQKLTNTNVEPELSSVQPSTLTSTQALLD